MKILDMALSSKGFLYSLAGTILIATNFITAKYGLRGFSPYTFSFIWTAMASFYTLVILGATGKIGRLRIPRNAVVMMALLGLATSVSMISFWTALDLLDPAFVSFLIRFLPVFTIALGYFVLGERFSSKEILPAVLMVGGGIMGVSGRWDIVGFGVTLIIISSLVGSLQLLIAKIKVADIDPTAIVFYRNAIGAALIAVWVFAFTGGLQTARADASHWAVTLVGAFLGPCLAHIFVFRAYRHWDLSRTTLVHSLIPLIVLPLAYLMLGEFPSYQGLAGGAVILVGSFWLVRNHYTQRAKEVSV